MTFLAPRPAASASLPALGWRWDAVLAFVALLAWAALQPADPGRAVLNRGLALCVDAVARQPGVDGSRLIPSSLRKQGGAVVADFGARRSGPNGWNSGELVRLRCVVTGKRVTLNALPGRSR